MLKALQLVSAGGIGDAKALVVGDDKGFSGAECVLGVELEIECVGVRVVVVSRCIGTARIHAVEADALSEVSDGAVLQVAEAVGGSGVKADFNAAVGGDSSGVVEGDPQAGCSASWADQEWTPVISPVCSVPSTQREKAD